jgi:hypothetical protein
MLRRLCDSLIAMLVRLLLKKLAIQQIVDQACV